MAERFLVSRVPISQSWNADLLVLVGMHRVFGIIFSLILFIIAKNLNQILALWIVLQGMFINHGLVASIIANTLNRYKPDGDSCVLDCQPGYVVLKEI